MVLCVKMLADECEEEGKEADQHDEGEQAGEDTPQEVRAEENGQNDPKKAIPEEVEAEDCRPELSRRPYPRTYAEWKVGGFLVPVVFRCAFHNLRLFFYAVAEPVWMVSWFRSFARPGLARARFLRQIRSPAGKEEDFAQNPRGA